MMRFSLRHEPPVRIAADALLPERLAALPPREIAALPLALGKSTSTVGDWFTISGSDASAIAIDGPCRRLDRIGAGMTLGSITVAGDAGAYLGAGMRGGTITVAGSAGFGVATAMVDGLIRIEGDAGDSVGGALAGSAAGMSDGVVIIGGNAGDAAAARLKRGLVVIAGDAGLGCGAAMRAGTVVIGGRLSAGAGAAMRRGSILALGGAAEIGACFADCGVHDLVFLRLLARALARLGLAELSARLGPLRRFVGDAAVGGRGELLLWE